VGISKLLFAKYFGKTQNSSERTAVAHASCCYLTDNEDHSLVQLCTILGTMGYDITCLVCIALQVPWQSRILMFVSKCHFQACHGRFAIWHKELVNTLLQLCPSIQREHSRLPQIHEMPCFQNWLPTQNFTSYGWGTLKNMMTYP